MTTIEEIKQMDLNQLGREITKEKQELLKLKLQTGAAQSKETHKLKGLRRHIARMQTIRTSLSKSV